MIFFLKNNPDRRQFVTICNQFHRSHFLTIFSCVSKFDIFSNGRKMLCFREWFSVDKLNYLTYIFFKTCLTDKYYLLLHKDNGFKVDREKNVSSNAQLLFCFIKLFLFVCELFLTSGDLKLWHKRFSSKNKGTALGISAARVDAASRRGWKSVGERGWVSALQV